MSTLMDLQRANLEKMAAREQEDREQKTAGAVLTSRHQDIMTDSNLDVKTSVNQSSNPSSQADVNLDGSQASRPARKKAIPPVAEPTPDLDPLDRALLQKLGRAYGDLSKGGSTLVSSRLPADVVERLGLAADLVKKHKKTKQDVITRGLILAFEELVKADGEVEWYE